VRRHHAIAIQRADRPLYCRLSRKCFGAPLAISAGPARSLLQVLARRAAFGLEGMRWFGMSQDPIIREKFTRLRQAAKKLAAEYFERFPKHRYQTEIESWRHLQSDNIEFTLKRLREPIDADNHRQKSTG
jgi:hypothetical protein